MACVTDPLAVHNEGVAPLLCVIACWAVTLSLSSAIVTVKLELLSWTKTLETLSVVSA